MIYIEHLLPFSISLKIKEVLIHHDGEIKGMGDIFSFVLMEAYSHPWKWHLYVFHTNSWVISLSLIHTNSMIHLTPLDCPKNASIFCHIIFWSLPVESMLPSDMSCRYMFKGILHMESTFVVINPSIVLGLPIIVYCVHHHTFVSVHTHLIYHITSLSCVGFVSMMWDTLWPSFDESILVDIIT